MTNAVFPTKKFRKFSLGCYLRKTLGNNDFNQVGVQRFYWKQGFGWSAQSRGLIKPGLGHCCFLNVFLVSLLHKNRVAMRFPSKNNLELHLRCLYLLIELFYIGCLWCGRTGGGRKDSFAFVLGNFCATLAFGPTFCDFSTLEQLLPFWAIFEQNIGLENHEKVNDFIRNCNSCEFINVVSLLNGITFNLTERFVGLKGAFKRV